MSQTLEEQNVGKEGPWSAVSQEAQEQNGDQFQKERCQKPRGLPRRDAGFSPQQPAARIYWNTFDG